MLNMLDKEMLIYSRHYAVWETPVTGKPSKIRSLPCEEPKVLAKLFLADIFQKWMRYGLELYFRDFQKKDVLKIVMFSGLYKSLINICENDLL